MKNIKILGIILLALAILSSSVQAAQVYDYWFDECHWNGTTGEVLDHSGNTNNGTAMNGAQTSSEHVIQRGAYFDGTDDYVELTDELETLRATGSLSVWIKTTQTGDDTMWRAPGITGIEEAGGGDDIFWGWIDASGHIGMTYANEAPIKSTTEINDDTWHHIVFTRDSSTGEVAVYVDGVEESSTIRASGTVSTSHTFNSIGRIVDTAGTHEYFQGYLDEVEIYDTVLTATEVQDIYDNESAGNNWDGSTRPAGNCSVQANDDAYVTDQNTDVSGNVLDNDTYPSGTTITTDTTGLDGTLTIDSSTGVFTYSPTLNFTGTTSFTYTIDDGNGNTSTATVHITVEAPIIIPANLVAEYRLDECGFDGTTGDVIDNTVNRLNGTTQNSVGKTVEPNKVCKGAVFNGTDQYIEVPDNSKFDFNGGGFTIAAWVYISSDDDAAIVSKMSGTGNDDGWDLELYSGDLYFDVNGWGGYARVTKPSENAWHHIVGVYTPNNGNKDLILYVDGSEADSADYNTTVRDASNDALTIASGGQHGYQEYFSGLVDEVKIWSRSLSSTEVSDMYTNEDNLQNWNDATDTRTCNTCSCPISANAGILSSFAADFRNMSINKNVDDKLSSLGTYGSDYKLWRRDYNVGAAPSGNNDAVYYEMLSNDDLEYGKAYWIRNLESSAKIYEVNLKTMDFNATITNYPKCRSVNGKCALVDLVSPNGTNNNGPYIYTMTSFPISKPIKWKDVRILITDGGVTTSYTPDEAAALGETFNATLWRYDQNGTNYTNITPGIPGIHTTIDPCRGYWIELDKNTAGKDVKLLIPQE